MEHSELKIECANVLVTEAGSASFDWLWGSKEKRWWATIALELVDTSKGKKRKLDKEFHLLACSKACQEKPLRKMPRPESRYTILQEKLNMKELRQLAKVRVSDIHAKSLEDFYRQMERQFFL